MKFQKFFGVLAAVAAILTLSGEEGFTSELKLRIEKNPTLAAFFEDASGNRTALRFQGRAWGPAQIAENGSLIRFKADLRQCIAAQAALQNKSFTFSAWAKADSLADTNAIVVNTTRPPCWGIVLKKHANEDQVIADVFYYWNLPGVPGALLRYKGELKKTDWHFYTCVFDRENEVFTFYVDGKSAGSVAMPKATPAFRENLTIGGGNGFFNGALRDVRITPAALSAEQVQSLYESTAPAEGQ